MSETQEHTEATAPVDTLPFLELGEQHSLPDVLQGAGFKDDLREKNLKAANVLECGAQAVRAATTAQEAQTALQALQDATDSVMLHDATGAAKSKLAFCISLLGSDDDKRAFCVLQLTAAAEDIKHHA